MQRVAAASAVLGPLLILVGFVGALSRPHQHSTTSSPAARTPSSVRAALPATPSPNDPPRTNDPPHTRRAGATPSPDIQLIDQRVETQVAAPAVTAAAAYTQTAVAKEQARRSVRTPVPGGPLLLGNPIEEAIALFGRPAAGSRSPGTYTFLPCARGGNRWSVLAQQGLVISITRQLCAGERPPAHWLQDLGAHLPSGTIFLGQSGPEHSTILRFYTNPALQAAQFVGNVGYGVPGCNGGGDPAGTLFASAHLHADGSLEHWTVSIGGCWRLH